MNEDLRQVFHSIDFSIIHPEVPLLPLLPLSTAQCHSYARGPSEELVLLDGLLQKERQQLPGGWNSSEMETGCNVIADHRSLQSLYLLIYTMLTCE